MHNNTLSQRLKIILCHTTHPGNIGATARAMKTMGLSALTLVSPRVFPSAEVTVRAAGADDILTHAKICTTLDEAIAGCSLVAATTTRSRHVQWPEMPPGKAAVRLLGQARAGQSVAVIFGPERSGLSNAELDRCNFMIRIPTNPDFSSLNIASAVQIICYELHRQLGLETGDHPPPAVLPAPVPAEQMARFYQQLEQTLVLLDYLDPDNPGKLMRRLHRLFNRNPPDDDEYHILMGVLAAVKKKLK